MSGFSQINTEHIRQFCSLIGDSHVVLDEETRQRYGQDYTEDLSFPPEVLLRPATVEEVSQLMSYCHSQNIPVTPIGALTGLSGGALSLHGGVGLSMERFDKILDIDVDNLQVTVEPAVITQVLQESVEAKGLFYPPDPASRGSCSIGGNLAESSGGPRAVKYGTTRDYVLNLEVVLADGRVFWTGADVLKNATGYDLTRLMIGSEGTLGIITKAVLKLIPKPTVDLLMLVPFNSARQACAAVSAVFRAGITPSAMEFMERDALELVEEKFQLGLHLPSEVQAHLLIELDGRHMEVLQQDMEVIYTVMEEFGAGEMLLAQSASEKTKLWEARRKIGEATKLHSSYKEEDTVVPRFRLAELLDYVKALGEEYGFRSVCYGHAGDGNLHVNILREDISEEDWNEELPKAIRALFHRVKELGGTISGEHGIGLVQKRYMDIVMNEVHFELLRNVKAGFDKLGILNPGKVF